MQKLSEYEMTTKAINEYAEMAIPESRILIKGEATDKVVTGAILEAAIRWGDYYLLFMTDDIPYEEMLSIHLLDRTLNLLDSVTIGTMYSTGSLSSLELVEPNVVGFRFIGNTDWRIELLAKPVFGLPFLSDPKGVSRKFGFTRHFKVHGHPLPESAG